MADFEADSKGLSLSCPSCGNFLTADADSNDKVSCVQGHAFTLPTLLLGQSIQAGTMIEAGIVLLQEQESLVRAIAKQLSIKEIMRSLQLEEQADKIAGIVESLRKIVAQSNDPGKDIL